MRYCLLLEMNVSVGVFKTKLNVPGQVILPMEQRKHQSSLALFHRE